MRNGMDKTTLSASIIIDISMFFERRSGVRFVTLREIINRFTFTDHALVGIFAHSKLSSSIQRPRRSYSSQLTRAAIKLEHLTVDVACRIAGDERDVIHDILNRQHAAQQ